MSKTKRVPAAEVRLVVRLPADTHKAITKKCQKESRSVNRLIVDAINDVMNPAYSNKTIIEKLEAIYERTTRTD